MSSVIADTKSLTFDATKEHLDGHFVYWTLCLETGEVEILDTFYDQTNFNLVVDERSLKNFFSRLLNVLTEQNFRSLRRFSYSATSFTQKHQECGTLALMILLISNFFDIYYLKSFTIKNYDLTITRFKQVLIKILLDGTFDYKDLSF